MTRLWARTLAITAFACLAAHEAAGAGQESPGSSADDTGSDARPRIGLVLGGGGARGAAHVGVLRELERQRVPIDAVAGTSMGAIIGGLYAAGHTPDEIEDAIRQLDWQDAFNDNEQRRHMRFRRKQDDRDYPIGFELGYEDGEFKLPRGAIAGQKVALILRDLTLHVPTDTNFDDLPIPFRAVAADLQTGERRVLGNGDIAQAIRASMAAPGVIAPVMIDGRPLVDGGLNGNVAVDTIREMGVDIVIAVDVEFPLYEPEQLESAFGVSYQMLTILIHNQTRQQLDLLGARDILLKPELGQFGSTDFANIAAAIEPGADAARAAGDRLRPLSLPEGAYADYLAKRQARKANVPEQIDFVRVSSDGSLAPEVLRARLSTQRGDPVNAQKLSADAESLYGLHTYERVGYRFVREDGRAGVEFRATGKSWGPNYLLFGLSLQDNFEGSTEFNLAGRLTRTRINRLGAEWRNDVQLGSQPFLRSEFYQPLSFDSRIFIAPRLLVGQTNLDVFSVEDRLARYRITASEAGVDFGRELGRWGEIRAGLFRGYTDASLKIGDPTLPDIGADTGGGFLRLAFDTLDNGQIPRDGMRGSLQWTQSSERLGADNNADFFEADVSLVRSFGRHSIEVGAVFNTSLEDTDLVQNFFPLGGFLRLSGLAQGEIAGPHAALARVVYYRRTGETGNSLFETPLYVGASLEAGNAWARRSEIGFDTALVNGSLFLGIDTVLGPLYLAAGMAEGGRSNFYLSFGLPP